ncbi:exonuclease domain-containing protein [Cognataquiflexum rubidum]|uniref:exonuclease domain-containing protein n=1 Tax=Cognataquiflexum rubidum TaxID=2922273 RepID=UPI001F1369F2|nr:exonuclease domain-containing protein [Cognataquiflexum rubidum]MCH6235221.1 GIY-YIG nuclease family protein [Cognataquiflexum rubidum]
MKYVIVDIETTGGNPSQGGITEIAAILHDGDRVVDRFHSLIDPERMIPGFITGLTGIDSSMVAGAPTFSEIADELYDFLKGNIFVAHNVNFDYSFIREALKLTGIEYTAPKLCTVRLSRKAFPGYGSYSLGRICEQLSISIKDRHRAMGDAEATVELFDRIIKGNPEVIFQTLKKANGESFLPPHISKERFLEIPESTGIYYFHDKNGQVIYVGKANDIRSRFKGHFSSSSKDKMQLYNEIHDVSWELTGNEFLAFLLESLEIKRLWPKFNKALKYNSWNWGLYQYEDGQGYIRFQVGKNSGSLKPILEFESHSEGWKFMMDQVEVFQLCPKLAGIQKTAGACYDFQIHKCLGACCNLESAEIYNSRVNGFLDSIIEQGGSVMIKETGIFPNETAFLYFENGVFSAYGFLDQGDSYSDELEIIQNLKKVKHLPETKYILRSFIPRLSLNQIMVIR